MNVLMTAHCDAHPHGRRNPYVDAARRPATPAAPTPKESPDRLPLCMEFSGTVLGVAVNALLVQIPLDEMKQISGCEKSRLSEAKLIVAFTGVPWTNPL